MPIYLHNYPKSLEAVDGLLDRFRKNNCSTKLFALEWASNAQSITIIWRQSVALETIWQ